MVKNINCHHSTWEFVSFWFLNFADDISLPCRFGTLQKEKNLTKFRNAHSQRSFKRVARGASLMMANNKQSGVVLVVVVEEASYTYYIHHNTDASLHSKEVSHQSQQTARAIFEKNERRRRRKRPCQARCPPGQRNRRPETVGARARL